MNIIFITYINRSGSTFLCQQLNHYRHILVCPEAEILIYQFLINLAARFSYTPVLKKKIEKLIQNDQKLKHWNIDSGKLENLNSCNSFFEAFVSILNIYKEKVKPNATVIIFKGTKLIDVFNNLPAQYISEYSVKCMAIVRDPRAIFYSQKSTIAPENKKIMNKNPITLRYQWNEFISKVRSVGNNNNFIVIKYEDYISVNDLYLKNILTFIKPIDCEKLNDSFYLRIPEQHKSIHKNILLPPIHEKIKEWENGLTVQQKFLIEEKCKNNLAEYSYPLYKPKLSMTIIFIYKLYYSIKFLVYLLKKRLVGKHYF